MHDSGLLVEPREGGPIAQLIHTVMRAKEYNDTFLTTVIEAEKAESPPTENASCYPARKKVKAVAADDET